MSMKWKITHEWAQFLIAYRCQWMGWTMLTCAIAVTQSHQTFTRSASPRVARNELIRLLKRCAGRGLQTSQQHQIYGSTFHSKSTASACSPAAKQPKRWILISCQQSIFKEREQKNLLKHGVKVTTHVREQ